MSDNAYNSDFKVKGFFIDLRNQVMTIEALNNYAKELSEYGINTLVIEWEATYPYEKHPIIANEVAYTREEIANFISNCKEFGIDVIPMQENYGHVEYILRHDRYSNLRVRPDVISQVCECQGELAKELFSDLISDLCAMFPSKYIFIGGDETRELGNCSLCKQKADLYGKDQIYAGYMKMIIDIVLENGKTPLMWADMILKYPKFADILPKETIMVDWNYGWKINHFGDIENLKKKGFKFWGAPSIRCHPDNWYLTDWKTHFKNQMEFIPYARSAGYEGIIMTSWSTSGVYGLILDSNNKIIDIQPIRNNYPLSGFRILVAMYIQALKQNNPINAEDFVVDYAQNKFGLSEEESGKFWKVLNIPQELIIHGKPVYNLTIKDLQTQNLIAKDEIDKMQPLKNESEFEHFKLMFDLRDYYLSISEVESIYNSEEFRFNDAVGLLNLVKPLIEQKKELNDRYNQLNKNFLKDEELLKQEIMRNKSLDILYNKLKAIIRNI